MQYTICTIKLSHNHRDINVSDNHKYNILMLKNLFIIIDGMYTDKIPDIKK